MSSVNVAIEAGIQSVMDDQAVRAGVRRCTRCAPSVAAVHSSTTAVPLAFHPAAIHSGGSGTRFSKTDIARGSLAARISRSSEAFGLRRTRLTASTRYT